MNSEVFYTTNNSYCTKCQETIENNMYCARFYNKRCVEGLYICRKCLGNNRVVRVAYLLPIRENCLVLDAEISMVSNPFYGNEGEFTKAYTSSLIKSRDSFS